MSRQDRPGYWDGVGDHRWGPGRWPTSAETWLVPPSPEVQMEDLREQAASGPSQDGPLLAGWVELAKDLATRRATPKARPRRSHQSPEERQAIRLKAMRLAWDKRGRPWDEAAALAMLREVELRGEVRVTAWPAQVR